MDIVKEKSDSAKVNDIQDYASQKMIRFYKLCRFAEA